MSDSNRKSPYKIAATNGKARAMTDCKIVQYVKQSSAQACTRLVPGTAVWRTESKHYTCKLHVQTADELCCVRLRTRK